MNRSPNENGGQNQYRYQYNYPNVPPMEPRRESKIKALLLALIFPAVYIVAQLIVAFIAGIVRSVAVIAAGGAAAAESILADPVNFAAEMMPAMAVVYSIVTVAAAALTIKLQGRKVLAELGFGGFRWVYALIALLLGVSLNLATSLLIEVLPIPQSLIDSYNNDVGDMLFRGSPLVLLLSMGILVPMAEEVAFRSMPFRALKRAFPTWAVVIFTGVLFAVIHMNPLQILYVLPTGILLGLVFVWSGAGGSFAAHIGYNSYSVLALALSGGLEPQTEMAEAAAVSPAATAVLLVLALATTAALTWALWYLDRKKALL